MSIHPDDPRLTDYALGELDEAARTELERELADSPEAAQALAEIRRVTGMLSASFADEQGPALDEARRAAILAAEPSVNGVPTTIAAASAPTHRPWSLRRALELGLAVGIGGVATALVLPTFQSNEVAVGTAARPDAAAINPSVLASVAETPADMGMEYEQGPVAHYELQDDVGYVPEKPAVDSLESLSQTDLLAGRDGGGQGTAMGESRDELHQVSDLADGAAIQPASQPAQSGAAGGQGGYGGGALYGLPPGGSPYGPAGGGVAGGRGGMPGQDRYYRSRGATPATASGPVTFEDRANEPNMNLVNGAYTWNPDGTNAAVVDGRPADTQTFTGESLADGESNTEAYDHIVENPFKQVAQEPLSTFSIDVDTAAYANVRRFLTQETLPPPGAVRIEEMLNYFSYDYAPPTGEDPFAVHVEVAQCPWEATHRLVRIGIKGREVAVDKRPATNLVFLIDVSGSMQDANKLQLVKTGLRLLTEQLSENDRVAMVVYAGSSGQVLASTPGNQKETILAALDQLEAGGSTNGAGGIEQAYQVAVENFIQGGANRVILCTDGDFNVGVTDESQLVSLIEGKAKSGVFLSVLGFGMGNLKDATLEKLSDKGNGNYAYIDTEREARKVLVEQLSGTLLTIAKDVKLQLEFNPAKASAYRLIGYENRILAKEDFNDDKKDAGEIGAGHTVTALYEVIPAGEPVNTPSVDELEYQSVGGPTEAAKQSSDLLMLKLRYKQPDGDTSKLMKTPVADSEQKIGQSSPDFQFASSVAAFGMLLRHSQYAGTMNYGAVLELAQPGMSRDAEGYRAEFIELVKTAQRLSGGK